MTQSESEIHAGSSSTSDSDEEPGFGLGDLMPVSSEYAGGLTAGTRIAHTCTLLLRYV